MIIKSYIRNESTQSTVAHLYSTIHYFHLVFHSYLIDKSDILKISENPSFCKRPFLLGHLRSHGNLRFHVFI